MRGHEVEDVDEGAEEVDEADPAEPVLLIGFAGIEGADGRADQVAGDAEGDQRDGIDPVIDADRQFPHVDAPILHGMLL